jgi:hypothetical protein
MPTALFSFKIDPDSQVRVLHVFFGETKAAAEADLRAHAEACPKFGPAWRANQTIEYAREVPELPPSDGDELEEWLDEILADAEDAEDEDICAKCGKPVSECEC